MGVFKKFIGGIALETLELEAEATGQMKQITVPPYRNTDGSQQTTIQIYPASSTYYTSWIGYAGIKPIPTADEIDNYSVSDYQVTAVGTSTFVAQKNLTATGGTRTLTLTITNNGAEEITVKCVKFVKEIYWNSNSTSNHKPTLVGGYYLDQSEWVTIPAGEIGTVTVVMTAGA